MAETAETYEDLVARLEALKAEIEARTEAFEAEAESPRARPARKARNGRATEGRVKFAELVKSAKPDPTRRYWLFDRGTRESIRGLALAVQPSGSKSWWYSYRMPGGPAQRIGIGGYPEFTLDRARAVAAGFARQVASGVDPRQARVEAAEAKRREAEELANRRAVADLAARYMEEYAPRKAKSSQVNDEVLWRLHILPRLGGKLVDEVTVADVADLHGSMRATPFQANRALSLLSTAFNLAILWQWRADLRGNPAARQLHKRIVFNEKATKRGRALDAEQLRRVGAAIEAIEDSPAKAALLLFMLTGCRPAEACGLRWADVDLPGRTIHLPQTKTGERQLVLGARAAALLAGLPRESEFVFPSNRRKGRPITTLRYIGEEVRKAAELPPDVRLYDCGRHSFKNIAESEPDPARGLIGAHIPSEIVCRLMGHATPGTTEERYRHPAPPALVRAADRVDAVLWPALFGAESEGGEVVAVDFGRRA